jgi:putative selenate reductase
MKDFNGFSIIKLAELSGLQGNDETIFGIHKSLFFKPQADDIFRSSRYGQLLETPLGVAAGPHTQMAQNIISAWLCGARYIELKTVQTLDELDITRPCIDISDEGYNCEWSQELKLDESFDEYLKAWIIIHILKDKYNFENKDEIGLIFNMSVGYDLKGIQNPNIQKFLNKMTNCSAELDNYIQLLEPIYPRIRDLKIPNQISNNLTISTMHGCPPEEIQQIAEYFIKERRFHTTVKLNPTLLGKEEVRDILNNRLGYDISVPEIAFEHDIKYLDAISMIRSLQLLSESMGVEFGIKLTNTLEVINNNTDLPGSENMVYMSGRALHPIAINLALKLQTEFKGNVDISFCAGVDAFNITDTLECGLTPVTVCSDLLKPGGYARLAQYFTEINSNLIIETEKHYLDRLLQYSQSVLENPRYKKSDFPYENIKTLRPLPQFDCAKAPCTETCATDQDVPAYMDFVNQGKLKEALDIVRSTNPFPHSTGAVCDHLCQTKCTRINYDSPLKIREVKRFIAESSNTELQTPSSNTNSKIAIIGAGPAGLSCAYFLLKKGCKVEVFEEKPKAGGMISSVIPEFRLKNKSIQSDVDEIISLGAKITYNSKIDALKFKQLQDSNSFIFIGTGAQKSRKLDISGENLKGVYDQLDFLTKLKSGDKINIGARVAVIGGGNSAMDVARAAKRIANEVHVIYRRTKKEMPANPEEIIELLEEGIEIVELLSPEKIIIDDENGLSLVCSKMILGESDESGRRRPVKIENSEFGISYHSVITAIGQEVQLEYFPETKIILDNNTQETQLHNVFAGGDFTRGASSLVNAVGDGKRAALEILNRINETYIPDKHQNLRSQLSFSKLQKMQATRIHPQNIKRLENLTDAKTETERCLQCDIFCNICVSVCPNRANISFEMDPVNYPVYELRDNNIIEIKRFKIQQLHQIVNIGEICNECGNCSTFCPTKGAPYLDKPKFYLNKSTFDSAREGYYFNNKTLFWKSNGDWAKMKIVNDSYEYVNPFISVLFNPSTMKITTYTLIKNNERIDLEHAITMAIFIKHLGGYFE